MDHAERHEQKVKTILVVENDEAIGEFLIKMLEFFTPYQALLATDGMQALEIVKTLVPDLFILDYFLSKINGVELYIHFQEIGEHQIYFVRKPFELDELLQMIETLLAA